MRKFGVIFNHRTKQSLFFAFILEVKIYDVIIYLSLTVFFETWIRPQHNFLIVFELLKLFSIHIGVAAKQYLMEDNPQRVYVCLVVNVCLFSIQFQLLRRGIELCPQGGFPLG